MIMISETMQTIFDIGLVPLVVLDNAEDAVPYAKALAAGGIPVAEVTFRTAAAKDTIAAMTKEVPEVITGAGTVHTVGQAQEAVSVGARFIVTPGFQPEVVRWCVEHQVDVIPGVVSPADIEQAMSFGLTVCKFFPAEAYGGIKTLKALSGPYAGIRFMPTGGVNADNMLDYLSLPNVAAVGGSFMVPSQAVKEKNWREITRICRDAVQKLYGFEIGHIGINMNTPEEAEGLAGILSGLFCQSVRETEGAFFAGNLAEVLKTPYLGRLGHICIDTRDIDRAVSLLRRKGIAFNEDTWTRDEKGRLTTVYLREEYGGFAIHIRRKPVK